MQHGWNDLIFRCRGNLQLLVEAEPGEQVKAWMTDKTHKDEALFMTLYLHVEP